MQGCSDKVGGRPQGGQGLEQTGVLTLVDAASRCDAGEDVDDDVEGLQVDQRGLVVAEGPVDPVEGLLHEVGNDLMVGAVAAASGGRGGLVVVHVVPPPAPGCWAASCAVLGKGDDVRILRAGDRGRCGV